jgi:hypothetical protein
VNRGGITIDVAPDRTILEASEQSGLRLPVGCRYGVCIIPNPICITHQSCPHPQPLSQAWERGARARGEGGVRARDFDCKRSVHKPDLVLLALPN